jgi:thymidine phosphorylase
MKAPGSTGFETAPDGAKAHSLKARRLGIRTHQEAVVYMRTDCHVCRSEGLTPQSRVLLRNGRHAIIATLHQVSSDLIEEDEAGLSEIAWERLAVREGDLLYASPWNLSEV